jgi:amino acid adenylation domain-containing protein
VQEAHQRLESTLSRRIRRQARQLGVSAASLFHFAWAQVLGRTAGCEDVVFGTVLFGRMHGGAGADRALGMFINTLPIRIRLGEVGVREGIKQTHESLSQLVRHEHASLALAQRCSGAPGQVPLFSALLNYRHSVAQPEEAVEKTYSGMQVLFSQERTNYPCTLSVDDLGSEFALSLQVAPPLPGQRLCRYLQQALEQVVQALEEQPLRPAWRIGVLDKAEREQLLVHWNDTRREYPQESCIHELFEAQVGRTPQAVAVVCERQSLTYAALDEQANRLARYLKELGVQAESRVALDLERSAELIIAQLAILKCGSVYVPLDEDAPLQRKAFMLSDCGAGVVLSLQGHELPRVSGTQRIDLDQLDLRASPAQEPSLDAVRGKGSGVAYVMYTSGSTGQPKGVEVPHRAIARLVLNNGYADFAASDRVAFAANPAFDASTLEVWAALLNGGCSVVLNREDVLRPRSLREIVREQRISVLWLSVGLFNQIARVQPDAFGSLRYLIVGGDVLEAHTIGQVLQTAPPEHLLNGYGPTETTTFAATYEIRQVAAGAVSVPIGRPIGNTRIYVLDEHGEPVPLGVKGEIYIGGAGVARGYLSRPELTAERFVKDPFSGETDARIYRTGDLGRYREDGNLEYLGRTDHQVKVRGYRIELGEIEGCLQKQPGIREAVVLAREGATYPSHGGGSEAEPGEKRLLAYVVSEGGALEVGELRERLSRSLPEYMLPAAYVQLERLPLTANGKVDRGALPAPDGAVFAQREYEEPRGELESALGQIWSQLLGVERVGRQDHFFELGGHSLLAVQLMGRVQHSLGLEVSLRELFEQPVLQQFAQRVSQAQHSELPPLQALKRPPLLPLSFAQQRLWFIAQLDAAAGAAYHIPAGLRLRGRLDSAALRRALDRIVERHEVLRTHFELIEGQAVQRIAPASVGFQLQQHDLRDASDGEEQIGYWSDLEAQAEFDLQHGPLIRGRLLRLAEQEHVLLVTMHHIVSDGWSLGVLRRELSALYRAFSEGEADPLTQLSIQYADYALWQQRWLEERLQEQLLYWKQQLHGVSGLNSLPTDRARPAVQDYAGERIGIELDEGLSAQLRALSRRHGTTLHMTLLAGWAGLVARLSGQEEVVIGTPVANRTRAEVEGLIGFFVNTLALRVQVSGGVRVGELLEQVRRCSVQGQSHQEVPFEQVVEVLRPERSLSHSPIFQLMFVWQNAVGAELDLGPLRVEELQDRGYRRAKYDLTLSMQEAGERIVGELEYASALYERSTMQRHVGYLQELLRGMVADDQQLIKRLPLLGEAEREQLLVQWNATRREYPQESCIHELFEAQVERTPDAVAVVCEGRSLSYEQLNEQANRLAGYLRDLGVGPEVPVAICAARSIELVVGVLATLKAGGAYVPLDPAYPRGRLSYMLQDSGALVLLHALVAAEVGLGLQEGIGTALVRVDLSADVAQWASRSGESLNRQHGGARSQNLANVIYTSGSTGQPKGVMVEHRNVCNLISWHCEEFRLGEGRRSAMTAGVGFDASTWEIWPGLCSGGTLVLAPAGLSEDPAGLLHWWQAQALDVSFLVTPLAELAFREGWINPGLEYLLVGGDRLRQLPVQPRLSVVNNYGPTETTVVASSGRLSAAEPILHIGRPIGNTRIYVLDEHGEPVPLGVKGELYIGGAGVARGYLNRPELTAERFVKDPFSAEADARMYRTGDLGRYREDGNLEYLGRSDHQVKLRGYRIELGEIEGCLQKQPGIREAVVLVRENELGEKRLVAYVVSESGSLEVGELREGLSRSLPQYMLPAAYVQLERMPLTANGKVDRGALPAPEGAVFAQREYEEPQGEVEEKLAQIWSQLLGVERVGRQDHFFELGGHSLLIAPMIDRLRQVSLQIDLRTVFDTPILHRIAGRLYPLDPLVSSHLVAIRSKGSRRPLFFMHDPSGEVLPYELLSRHLDGDQPVYGLRATHDDAGPITNEALAERYVRVIRSVQPHGPYRVAGWSGGGLIAYEMARQLLSEKEPVEFLGVIDSQLGTAEAMQKIAGVEQMNWNVLLGLLRKLRPDLDESKVSGLKSLGSTAAAIEHGKRMGWFTARITTEEVSWRASRAWHLAMAWAAYRAQPLPIRVYLFRADILESEDASRGWAAVMGDDLRIELIGGTHLSIMEEPHIGKLAASIEHVLAQTEQTAGRDPHVASAMIGLSLWGATTPS